MKEIKMKINCLKVKQCVHILMLCVVILMFQSTFSSCSQKNNSLPGNTVQNTALNQEYHASPGTEPGITASENTSAPADDANANNATAELNINNPEQQINSVQNDASKNKIAYLTFDDGPSENNTVKNLETLAKYSIKATFFVLPDIGKLELYKKILSEGHVLGNHSYTHNYTQIYASMESFQNEITRAEDFFMQNIGCQMRVFRFPGGSFGRNEAYKQYIIERSYRYFDWDASTGDTDPSPYGKMKDVLVNNVLTKAQGLNSCIVLMHDDASKTTTAEALPEIIEGLQQQGYRFDVLKP